MKTQPIKALGLILSLAAILITVQTRADQHQKFSSADGLSNNAILCMHQNRIGHIYIGTADGLNIWDGASIKTFHASDGYNYFFGNMIRHIHPYQENTLYIQTSYGVARLDTQTDEMQFYKELAFYHRIAINKDGNVLTMDRDGNLYIFDILTRKLSQISNRFLSDYEYCHRIIFTKDGRLCIFTERDIYIVSINTAADGSLTIGEIENRNIRCRYVSPTFDGTNHYIITSDDRLCTFDNEECSICCITGIEDMPNDYVSGICPADDGYYLSFRQFGLFFLPKGKTRLQSTAVDCGIFSIIPDKRQPIIWIGTDSNGFIKYRIEEQGITCLTYDDLPHSIRMPVRSIIVDKERSLWFGTKGDGLFRIRNFGDDASFRPDRCEKFNTKNSRIANNSVYALTESRHDLLWIGTDGDGLCMWSYKTGQIEKVEGSDAVGMVHSIIEQNDSTLWVATDDMGVFRCSFEMKNGIPLIADIENIDLCEPFNNKTSIFSMSMQNDSTIWFGSRGQGVLSYDMNSGKSRVIQFPTDNGFAINETFFVNKSDRMLFATGNGLVTYSPDDNTIHVSEHVPQKATHGIVCDSDKNIWISTNSGIISLDSTYNYRLSLNRFSNLDVLEYSDGACCFDHISGKVLFGGINGLTIIGHDTEIASSYTPEINITRFIQNNRSQPIHSMVKDGRLKVPFSKSMFGIQFSIVDNLNYSNYEVLYKIEGHSPNWITNDRNVIYLPSLEPGRYNLKIAYVNHAIQYRSEECVLPIHITPPFYRSWWAYLLYVLLIGTTIYLAVRLYMHRYHSMQEKMRRKYSDEILKTTSETTNAITEDLSVQLTFIIGLCQQIRLTSQNNSLVANKVNLVEYNIAKINKTLHIFNEYKGITEALINSGQPHLIPVSQTATGILELMRNNTKLRKVTMTYHIEDDITISINKEAFLTMLYSLIYKVISTTNGEKKVSVDIRRRQSKDLSMTINFSSDRNTYENISSCIAATRDINYENEYDIVFCNLLITKMNGSMAVTFDETSGMMSIEVILPPQKIREEKEPDGNPLASESINTYNTNIGLELPKNFKNDAHTDFVYIISNSRDISSFLGYFLSDSYNVYSFNSNSAILEKMEQRPPIAVIYDVSSMHGTLPDFLEKIKTDRRLEQVITISLTSPLQMKEREEYTKHGVDLCISFPFNMNYLRETLEQKILKQKNSAAYYRSPISTYTINEGKYIHLEDKEFMNKLLLVINQNISNANLTAPDIAKHLCMSTRVMYRKLESITDKKLHQIIKETRMSMTASLLASSKHTIDEIMYKVGYDNRSTFHRNFKEIYGMTPREYRGKVNDDTLNNLTVPGV